MKIGPLEGTADEVNDFFQNNGLNPLDYFQKPEPALAVRWPVIPSLLTVLSFTVLVILGADHEKVNVILFLIGFSSSVWLAVSVHIRFKTVWGAGAIIFSGLLIMLVALGVIRPEQLTDYYRGESTHNN